MSEPFECAMAALVSNLNQSRPASPLTAAVNGFMAANLAIPALIDPARAALRAAHAALGPVNSHPGGWLDRTHRRSRTGPPSQD